MPLLSLFYSYFTLYMEPPAKMNLLFTRRSENTGQQMR